MIFQFKSLKSAAVTAVNNGTAGTPTGAAHDEESDVMTTMEKLEAEAKDVSPSDACQFCVTVWLVCVFVTWVKLFKLLRGISLTCQMIKV